MTTPETGKTPSDKYLAYMGRRPRRIPHHEHLSNPDFFGLISGVDPYEHPRTAALKTAEHYAFADTFAIPASDDPIPRPDFGDGSTVDEEGRRRVRWGAGTTSHWEWGTAFRTIDDVLAYEPLDHLDLREVEIIEKLDYRMSEDEFHRHFGGPDGPEDPPVGEVRGAFFYNTLFMWPLLTFGWELFLELAGAHKDELKRLLADFAVLSRKIFRAYARLPVNVVTCHDDVCMARGPVCSPAWLREFIYPYYEEFFDILHSGSGERRVVFISDGNIDAVADDLIACGVDGLVSEPFTDWKSIARKYPQATIAGEGDNRILMRNNPAEIEAMIRDMVATAEISDGYMMSVGNHIPWNVPPEAVKSYFDLSRELGVRNG